MFPALSVSPHLRTSAFGWSFVHRPELFSMSAPSPEEDWTQEEVEKDTPDGKVIQIRTFSRDGYRRRAGCICLSRDCKEVRTTPQGLDGEFLVPAPRFFHAVFAMFPSNFPGLAHIEQETCGEVGNPGWRCGAA